MYRSMKSFKKAWVKALRSGEYIQGQGTLCTAGEKHDNFCCLGVAANLLVLASGNYQWIETQYFGVTRHRFWKKGKGRNKENAPVNTFRENVAPKWLMDWLNTQVRTPYGTTGRQDALINLNDRLKLPFNKIADMIEKWD